MIAIVVVSHSPDLANAAVSLALEMTGEKRPRIAVAAGAGDGVIGTDAIAVAAAIDEVAGADRVLVFMDLGSAVLSTKMALEFVETTTEVRLSAAPFVEGIVAGIVLAAAGASLEEADREASGAMAAKNAQLAPAGAAADAAADAAAGPAVGTGASGPGAWGSGASGPGASGEVIAEATLVNDVGLHARPASVIVAAMADFDARVTIGPADAAQNAVSAASLLGLMGLGATKGTMLRIAGTGPDAARAVEAIRAMVDDGFGEL